MIPSALFAKYDVPVPRYTSYPTVPEWSRTPTTDEWIASLETAISAPDASIALYVHLPFCESLCTFCGCNTVITRDHSRAEPYTDLVLRELDAYLSRVPALGTRPFNQLHFGGGTPTFSSPEVLQRFLEGLSSRLTWSPRRDFEASVEADPRVTTRDQLDVLRAHGFSRLSLGIQDFNPETQRLVNRVQSPEMVRTLVGAARAAGYTSVNFDLIYGLPAQSPASMQRTAEEVLSMEPDRLAVYSFARVPWIKPQQRKFTDDQIPTGAEKRALYETIRQPLIDRGYVELGLDHFALPHDGLARAAANGSMHRNFQGYTERRTTVLLGLGVSAISETSDCYHQNEKIIKLYERRTGDGEIATLRGHRLSDDEQRRRERILSLMTTFEADLDPDDEDDARAFLAPIVEDGLAVIDGGRLRVTQPGRAFLRNIAAVFDRELRTNQPTTPTYSRAV